MSTCFVIQPFDSGPFDKRFDDILAPAIEAAGLQVYRVDRDPAASIPIDQIESGIRAASVCLAEITKDNPNVWFELGYAIAAKRDVVLVCSKQRDTPFPFDVQHRSIIRYATDSTRDFDDLRASITDRIKAILSKQEALQGFADASPLADVEGLNQQEMVALVSIGQNADTPERPVSVYVIRQDMEKSGYTRIATTLSLTSLLRKGLIGSEEVQEFNSDPFTGYHLKHAGMDWLLANQDRLVLRHKESHPTKTVVDKDDIPF